AQSGVEPLHIAASLAGEKLSGGEFLPGPQRRVSHALMFPQPAQIYATCIDPLGQYAKEGAPPVLFGDTRKNVLESVQVLRGPAVSGRPPHKATRDEEN